MRNITLVIILMVILSVFNAEDSIFHPEMIDLSEYEGILYIIFEDGRNPIIQGKVKGDLKLNKNDSFEWITETEEYIGNLMNPFGYFQEIRFLSKMERDTIEIMDYWETLNWLKNEKGADFVLFGSLVDNRFFNFNRTYTTSSGTGNRRIVRKHKEWFTKCTFDGYFELISLQENTTVSSAHFTDSETKENILRGGPLEQMKIYRDVRIREKFSKFVNGAGEIANSKFNVAETYENRLVNMGRFSNVKVWSRFYSMLNTLSTLGLLLYGVMEIDNPGEYLLPTIASSLLSISFISVDFMYSLKNLHKLSKVALATDLMTSIVLITCLAAGDIHDPLVGIMGTSAFVAGWVYAWLSSADEKEGKNIKLIEISSSVDLEKKSFSLSLCREF